MNEQRPTPDGHDRDSLAERQKLCHEMRSTAQGLLGYLLIFSDEVKPQLNAQQTLILERINFFAKKMADMLMDFLADSGTPKS